MIKSPPRRDIKHDLDSLERHIGQLQAFDLTEAADIHAALMASMQMLGTLKRFQHRLKQQADTSPSDS